MAAKSAKKKAPSTPPEPPDAYWAESVAFAQKLAKLIWENHRTPYCAVLYASVGGFTDEEFGDICDRINWDESEFEKVRNLRSRFAINPDECAPTVQEYAKIVWKNHQTNDSAMLAAMFGALHSEVFYEVADRFEWSDEFSDKLSRLWFIELFT